MANRRSLPSRSRVEGSSVSLALENPNAPQSPQKAQIDYVTFWVPGKPIGQGRISTIRGHSFHSNQSILEPWRHNIGYCARMAHVPLLEGAVKLRLNFYFQMPKTVKRDYPTVAPDLDHLVRAVGDALSGIAFIDDSHVVALEANEFYGIQGVEISVGELLPKV